LRHLGGNFSLSNICSLSKNGQWYRFYLSEPNQGHLNIEWVPPENIIIIKLITVYLTFDQSSEQLFYLKLENFVIANLIDWIL
jgi:hypothetical protein